MKASAQQIGFIHSLAKKAGMDEDTRRGFMDRWAGVRSTTELSVASANTLIDKLKPLAGVDGGSVNGAVAGLDTPVAGKMRALWIAGYDLGLVRDRTDRAMLSFLERQSGVSHTQFLNEPGQATAAIEALKSWLARDAGVEWPPSWKRDGKAGFEEIADSKWAVIEAQWRKAVSLNAGVRSAATDTPSAYAFSITRRSITDYELAHYDRVQNALGRRLRAALPTKEPR